MEDFLRKTLFDGAAANWTLDHPHTMRTWKLSFKWNICFFFMDFWKNPPTNLARNFQGNLLSNSCRFLKIIELFTGVSEKKNLGSYFWFRRCILKTITSDVFRRNTRKINLKNPFKDFLIVSQQEYQEKQMHKLL